MSQKECASSLDKAKQKASRMMHLHYCENNVEELLKHFAPDISWFGAGEEQYAVGKKQVEQAFGYFKGVIPKCNITGEEYYAEDIGQGLYLVTGRMWISTAPKVGMILKVHQRVTFLFRDMEGGLQCFHIHCSNPYQELVEGEQFPQKIGKQSYEYMQELLLDLKEEVKQQKRQIDVIMDSISGGLKISNDDDTYSYAYVSPEAAALFGYTVEEFIKVTGNNATGNVYPPDLPQALADCKAAFENGGISYSTKYRVRCKDGSLKWIIDSGKKAQNTEGKWMVNSLYLDITHSEEDSQRIREQSKLLQSIYNTVPCGIIRFVQEKNGKFELISINSAVLHLMGYESMQEAFRDWQDGMMGTVLPADRKILNHAYRSLQKIGDSSEIEYRVSWKDGSLHWMNSETTVVAHTEDGLPVIQRTVMDITQRKSLQLQLGREQELYRAAMECNSDMMYEYFMDTDTLMIHEMRLDEGMKRKQITHYSEKLKANKIVHPDDVQLTFDNICKGRAEMFEMRALTSGEKGLRYVWNRVTGKRITENGKLVKVVGTIRSIQGMKETLLKSDELLHMNQSAIQAISSVYIGIFYVDLSNDRYYCIRIPESDNHENFSRNGCYSTKLGKMLMKFVDADDEPNIKYMFDRNWLIEKLSGENNLLEREFRLKEEVSGTPIWIQLGIHLVAKENGKARTVILTCRNISKEKLQKLEHRKEEKKAKEALEEAYEAVNRASLAKSDFLSKVSHDIRTPMNAILGMTTIAEQDLDDKENVADCLSKIQTAGKHLLGLINEVLDMSKIDSGNIKLNEEEFCLPDTLDNVREMMEPEVKLKNQLLVVEGHRIIHKMVCGDAMRVQQIMMNLLSNAIKYTQEGGHIRVAIEEKLQGQGGIGCYELVVEDDGIGMSREFLQKLFVPFERAEDSRVSKIQGTGLGMAITWNLVHMFGGSIQVKSRPEKGTRFTVLIYLKLLQSDLGEEEKIEKENMKKDTEQIVFPPETQILLVEDNEINREIACKILQMHQINVTCAVNGREAFDLFDTNPPGTYHMILMDVQMPVMDGYSATRAIRRLAEEKKRSDAAEIPIIALTANAFADDICRSREAGMNDHVTKPLDVGHLMKVIKEWLPKSK